MGKLVTWTIQEGQKGSARPKLVPTIDSPTNNPYSSITFIVSKKKTSVLTIHIRFNIKGAKKDLLNRRTIKIKEIKPEEIKAYLTVIENKGFYSWLASFLNRETNPVMMCQHFNGQNL